MHLRRQMMRVYQADIKTVDAFAGASRENIHCAAGGARSLTRISGAGSAGGGSRMQVLEQVDWRVLPAHRPGDTQAQQLAETLGAGGTTGRWSGWCWTSTGRSRATPTPCGGWSGAEQWRECRVRGSYREVLTDSILRRTRFWARKLTETAAWMEQYPDLYRGYGDRFLEMAEQLQGYETAAQEGWDAMARLKPAFRRMGVVKGCDGAKEQAQAVRKRCKDELDEIGALLAVSESEQLEDLEAMAPAMLALVQLTEDFTAAYQAEKVRRNCMDFSDQEHYAIRLLQGDDGAPTPLGRQLPGRYREIMVDEYQDTNEVQNCIFRAISRDGQNLFTVGDVKQSIYRFRLADPTIFLEKYLAYRLAEEAEEGQPRKVLLSQNFRSRRQVLSAANFVFGSIMSRQMGEMDYGPEEQLNYGATGYPERSDTDTEFHLISVADSEEERFDRTEVEARFVAHRIRQLLDEGFPVQGEDGQQRPVRPEDIVILMRSPAARRKAFTAALQREDIPCAGGEEQSFFETMEIAVMVSFLQIVDNPRQDVPLLAVLRSPLLGFSPDRLAQIRGGHPGGDYYGALCADDGEDSRAFLERLAQLRAAAGELTADRLLWKLYTDWQALAVFGAMEGGAQRRSNLLALYAYAGQLAAAGRGNLFDFVSYLHDLMESGDLPDISARQESGGVQLMTIHKSKGLEFPVVILADLQKGFNRDDFQRPVLVHPRLGLGTERVDRQRRIRYDTVSKQAIQLALSRESLAEEMRILYVAMTRAKEKLICVDCMRFARNRSGACQCGGLSCGAGGRGERQGAGDWILAAVYAGGGGARQWADMEPEQPALSDGGWQVRLWENPVFECGSAARPGGGAVQERRYDLSAMELRYGHTAACTIPTKVTATQLKGRVLDEEIAEGGIRPPGG
ncbi:MAG: 3'-5' exonuclease [Oscillospiraceae bacterium]